MESLNSASASARDALLRKIGGHYLGRAQTLWTRLRSKYKKSRDEFKLLLIEYPSLAWTLRITVPLAVMLILMGIIITYNIYSTYSTDSDRYRAQVGVEVKRRSDLIPNLVACVNRYEIHEKDIMKHIADARQALSGPGDINEKIAASRAMQGALGRLLAIVEQYPNLKASEPVQSLIKELSNTENRIAENKGKYNENAQGFNQFSTTFPTNIIGWCFGYRTPMPYIDTEEDLVRAYAVNAAPGQVQ